MPDAALKEFLAKTSFFGGLAGTPVFDRVADMLRAREVKKGEFVVREGDTGTSMYIVLSGALLATRRCEDGTEVRMLLFRPGDFVGVTTLIEMEPRPFTIAAEKDSQLLELDSKDLYQLYRQDQKAYILVLQNINRELVRRLRKAGARIAHLTRLAGVDQAADHH
ncbi:MAG TPA: cyclic nucleotide-binding domain-containing protein [Myxococcales bacterium]|nr:cyclic nucleotide-binding domain-containing protein [Myxococcales bacterium]